MYRPVRPIVHVAVPQTRIKLDAWEKEVPITACLIMATGVCSMVAPTDHHYMYITDLYVALLGISPSPSRPRTDQICLDGKYSSRESLRRVHGSSSGLKIFDLRTKSKGGRTGSTERVP